MTAASSHRPDSFSLGSRVSLKCRHAARSQRLGADFMLRRGAAEQSSDCRPAEIIRNGDAPRWHWDLKEPDQDEPPSTRTQEVRRPEPCE
jgi:hypothetical protein